MVKGELLFCGSRLTGANKNTSDLDSVFVLDETGDENFFNRNSFFIGDKIVDCSIITKNSKEIRDGKILYSKRAIELPKFRCSDQEIFQLNPSELERFLQLFRRTSDKYREQVWSFMDNPNLNDWFSRHWKDFEIRIRDQVDYILNGNPDNRQIITRLSGEEFGDVKKHERSEEWFGRIGY